MESKLNQLTFEAIMLRDTRLKTDVNSARFMSDEPASFFARLLVRAPPIKCSQIA